jgi:hypothetical protein
VPAFTVSVAGEKLKLSIDTALDMPSARANSTPAASSEPTAAPSAVAAITGRNIIVLLSFATASESPMLLSDLQSSDLANSKFIPNGPTRSLRSDEKVI